MKNVKNASDVRQLADLYRRLASIPTAGGHSADRLLLELAARLDREAAERQIANSAPADYPKHHLTSP
jgi:hypothetical protein